VEARHRGKKLIQAASDACRGRPCSTSASGASPCEARFRAFAFVWLPPRIVADYANPCDCTPSNERRIDFRTAGFRKARSRGLISDQAASETRISTCKPAATIILTKVSRPNNSILPRMRQRYAMPAGQEFPACARANGSHRSARLSLELKPGAWITAIFPSSNPAVGAILPN
jgi:hypothetical protein